ncbi:hypothetical protein [Rhizobium sp. Root482]|uniref:hypothetical protein n=1 Tax=Rhizobium sp. Root482 TaxID=1736543 RepID=UPI0006F3BE60|nr:hypothetical protein [Rhizobium sp. Root482]KQY15389.1 hypothetical protein ASD31_08435 [Rhizobium sp. Root482]
MRQIFAKLALAGLIGLSGLGAATVPASADTLSFRITSGDAVKVQYREGRRHGDERDWNRDRRHGHGWGHHRRGRCDPWLATDKARARGLHRARVVDVTPRRVVVEGRRHGAHRSYVFANARGCPFIGR